MGRRLTGYPLARAEGLLSEDIGSERVVLDTTSGRAHLLSALTAAVFALCDGRTPVEDMPELVSALLHRRVGSEEIQAALMELEAHALFALPPVTTSDGISRRTLVRRTAAATAAFTATAPLITSIVTPAFAVGSPGRRCPGSRCVSQSEGDVFCGCNNACPPGSPGAGSDSTCTSQGLSPPFFDSCFCAKCPSPGDPKPGQVPAGFEHLCLPPGQQTTPCGGGGTPNMGCNDPSKPLDGICVPNDGDSSETCLNP